MVFSELTALSRISNQGCFATRVRVRDAMWREVVSGLDKDLRLLGTYQTITNEIMTLNYIIVPVNRHN